MQTFRLASEAYLLHMNCLMKPMKLPFFSNHI